MSCRRLVIRVDHRERASPVPALLGRKAEIRVTSLRAGDYAFGRVAGIERKTHEDFARSVVDARLFKQMTAMTNCYERPLLVLEKFRLGKGTLGVRWEALRGALVSVTAVFGVPILHSSGPEETAELVVVAARQLERLSSDGYHRPGYRPKGLRRRALFILQGLPRIGPRRAASLLREFGSVRDVIAADEASLARVWGIGAAVAGGVSKAVGNLSSP